MAEGEVVGVILPRGANGSLWTVKRRSSSSMAKYDEILDLNPIYLEVSVNIEGPSKVGGWVWRQD